MQPQPKLIFEIESVHWCECALHLFFTLPHSETRIFTRGDSVWFFLRAHSFLGTLPAANDLLEDYKECNREVSFSDLAHVPKVLRLEQWRDDSGCLKLIINKTDVG